jgi:hypothetical protein
MPEFIVHAIDKSAQFVPTKELTSMSPLDIRAGKAENGEIGDVVISDSFYLIEDDSEIDAAISISNIIRVKNGVGELVPISEFLKNTKATASIDDDNFIPLRFDRHTYANKTSSMLIQSSFQIDRVDEEEQWIELHEISFYITPREKILYVRAQE